MNKWKRWTAEEDELILFTEMTNKEIGLKLNRTRQAVCNRINYLKDQGYKIFRENDENTPADYSGIDQYKIKRLAEKYGQPGEIERVLPIDLKFEVGDSCNLMQSQKKAYGERIKGKVIAEYETFYLIDTGNYKTTVYKRGSGFRRVKGA